MVRFTFVSGKEQEFEYEWNKLAPKLQLAGLRLFTPAVNIMIPLNSNTIALIENFPEVIEEPEPEIQEDNKSEEEIKEEINEAAEEEKLSVEEQRKQILDEMKKKSSCTHEEKEYYYQEIMAGPRNNRQMQKRYFPVCKYCGVRERYVKSDALTDEEKANAKLWDK